MCKLKLFLCMVFVAVGMVAAAQGLTVTGKVMDGEGYEVIGGTVALKGAAGVGTVTDADGNYSIKVPNPQKDILVFSYVGMMPQEVKVNGQKVIDVTLRTDAVMLDEVVAVGYGTQRRGDLTGSVASVGSKELMKVPTSDITQALAGRMAGVQVNQSEGEPGASISIRVRGGMSITQSNEPLYVIDGFPSEDGLSTIDPAEIESITILKDASATAIYGARGANGVVVVTTKKAGKNNRATVTFDSYIGFRKIAKKLDVLSPYEFVLLDYERRVYDATTQDDWNKDIKNFEERYGKYSDIQANYGNRKGIDWQQESLGRTALVQNYRVGVSGGTDKLNYSLAYSYFDEDGAMVFSGNKKHNISFSINHQLSKRLSINARISYDQMKISGMGTSSGGDRFNKMQHILQYRPTIGINGDDSILLEDEDPIFVDDTGNVMQNPLLSAAEETNDRQFRTIQANGGFNLKLFKGLSFRNTTGMRYQIRRNDIFYGDKSVTAKRTSINGSIENIETGSFQTSNVLQYNWSNKINELTAMVGQEYVDRWTRRVKASATNFPNDEIGLADMSLGIPGIPESSENYDDKLLSFFARVNYSFMNKYLLTASFRADGSSKFGKNNKWGYFPAVSAAWRMSEEQFIKDLNVFSDLKLRVGYGMAGNNRINSYLSLAVLESVNYPNGNSTTSGYVSKQIPNPDLKWEANKTFNLGVDLGFFNQRLTISPEFYINRSSNLLLNAKLPNSAGYTSLV
ncbi:MAG: SusC/RagA family TonB-linked outer membrane protein, partial [Muribaculaceae bacterium]|nr:SusC/RagA family TonB-linked outer membrane protein [Muribaculaceae bacterium]